MTKRISHTLRSLLCVAIFVMAVAFVAQPAAAQPPVSTSSSDKLRLGHLFHGRLPSDDQRQLLRGPDARWRARADRGSRRSEPDQRVRHVHAGHEHQRVQPATIQGPATFNFPGNQFLGIFNSSRMISISGLTLVHGTGIALQDSGVTLAGVAVQNSLNTGISVAEGQSSPQRRRIRQLHHGLRGRRHCGP